MIFENCFMKNQIPEISIIVPVFNTGMFIRKCLDSILGQTFADWECILVDDGSSDDSGLICEEYVAADNRFMVFHKENGGVSSARNLGLDNAKGKWVTFVDSDDIIYKEALAICLRKAEEENLDLLQFSYTRDISQMGGHEGEQSEVLNTKRYFEFGCFPGNVCLSVMRFQIIKDFSMEFDNNMKLGEDQLFLYEYMEHSKRICKIDNILYYYNNNPKSAVNNEEMADMIYSCYRCISFKESYPETACRLDGLVLAYIERLIQRGESRCIPDILGRLKPRQFSGHPWCTTVMVKLARVSPTLAVKFESIFLPRHMIVVKKGSKIKHTVFRKISRRFLAFSMNSCA